MTIEEAKHKLDFMKKAYQKLIDEKVDSGKSVGDGVSGEWKTETPLDEAYKSMIDALEMAIKALEQEPCEDVVSRQAVLDLPRIKTHNVFGNVIYESVDVENVRRLPSVTPQPKMGRWQWNFQCSLCHNIGERYYDYCPGCGAKMQEVEE